METAIQKAIEGGWKVDLKGYEPLVTDAGKLKEKGIESILYFIKDKNAYAEIRENPLFWQALGKSLGWEQTYKTVGGNMRTIGQDDYREHWHRFIDHLASGKDAESFFNELLK